MENPYEQMPTDELNRVHHELLEQHKLVVGEIMLMETVIFDRAHPNLPGLEYGV